jgi:KaiC/GvpD/RAD55 family RecA-like ATPase
MNLQNALQQSVTVVLLPPESYSQKATDLASAAAAAKERVCYVCLGRPHRDILGSLEKAGARTERIFFIDAATRNPAEPREDEPVAYVSSPRALSELGITIRKVVEAGSVQCLVVDSLSALLMYEKPSTVLKFANSVVSSATPAASVVLMLVKDSAAEGLVRDLSMFADGVADLEEGGDA